MQIYLNILMLTLIAGVTAFLARERGRDPILWFFIGVLFSVFGLIALLMLPNPATDQTNKETPEKPPTTENSVPPVTQLPLAQPPPSLLELPPANPLPPDQWFYMDRNWQMAGPWTLQELQQQWKQGDIPLQSLFWNPNLQNWSSFEQIEGLKSFLDQAK